MEARTQFLTVTMTVRVPTTGMDVNQLEAEWIRASREGFARSVRMMQERFQRQHGDRLERRGWCERRLETRLGSVRLELLKVRDRETGMTVRLGNDLLELTPRQRVTRWVERCGVELRVRGLSYRAASEVVGEFTGNRLSHVWLWTRVQKRGRARCRAEDEATRQVFERGGRSSDPPERLYLEADEIHLKAQRSERRSHRVKVGLSYTGRERQKGYKRPRYALAGKRLYGGVESISRFGRQWYGALERHCGVSRVKAVLYLSDGDPALIGLQETHFPQAIRQHDWAHVFRDIRSAAPDETRRARWVKQLCEGRSDLAARNMQAHLRGGSGDREAIKKVLHVVGDGGADFYGWKRFQNRHDPDRTQKIPRGTGGIEKNQEVMIGRAMKKRGMAWTAHGANHLAKLIFAWQDKTTWNLLWNEPSPV